jgi:hypothetical protein
MSETIDGPRRYPETSLLTAEQLEALRDELNQVSANLIKWFEQQGLNDEDLQTERARKFQVTGQTLTEIIDCYGELYSHQLWLIVGRESVKAWVFETGAHSMEVSHIELPPYSVLTLDTSRLQDTSGTIDQPTPQKYYFNSPEQVMVGESWGRLVPETALARTLSEGGRLELVYIG